MNFAHLVIRTIELTTVACIVALTVMVLWIAINESRGDRRMIVVNQFTRRCKDCTYRLAGSSINLDGIFAAHECIVDDDQACCEPDYSYDLNRYVHTGASCRGSDYEYLQNERR